MNKEKDKKEKILRSSFFLKLFGIPSISLILLEILSKNIPDEDGYIITWTELLQETLIAIAVWFIISFVITLIINEVKKSKPKTKIIKEVQYITSPNDKIVIKTEEIQKDKTQNEAKKNSKCLYICESIVDGYEYKKMVKYFPKKVYWVFALRGTILNILITAFIAIISQSWIETLIFFIVFEIYLLILYRIRLGSMAEKVHNARLQRGKIEASSEIEFYEDYFIRKGKNVSITANYSEITRCIENDTNFYLEYPNQNMVINLQKNRCDLELINFIRTTFKIENHIGDNSNFKGVKEYHNPKFIRNFMNILFIITICSLWGALWTFAFVSEINPQHGFNFIRNAWVFWCWLPIPVLSIILGFKYKNAGFKCTKNIVGGFIIVFLMLIYGSFCLMPTFEQDYNKIDAYKNYIDAPLPNNGELEIQNWGTYFDEDKTNYTIINVYYDKEDVNDLVNGIENSNNWILSKEIKSELKILIPSQLKSDFDAYYSIYNKTTNEYNTLPTIAGNYEIYAMKYDKSDKHLEIHKFDYNYK